MSTPPMIDLDAAKREASFPGGIPVVLGGVTFTLPAELPLDIFDPLLSDELDLVGVVTGVMADRAERRRIATMNDEDTDGDEELGAAVVNALMGRPALPKQTVAAILDTFAVLFGAEQWEQFLLQKPSIPDLMRLVRGLLPLFAVSLGESFASPSSSVSDGATPKPTSELTTDSTSEESGSDQAPPAS